MEQHFATYQTVRPRLIAWEQSAVEWGMQHRHVFERAARKLGIFGEQGTPNFEDEPERSVLRDALIYEEQVQQRKVITAFLSGHACRDDNDYRLAEAMRTAKLGLYRIEAIDAERAALALKALIAEATDTTLINEGLARTAKPGCILALRLLYFPDFAIASGVVFPFAAGNEHRLVREWRKKYGLERLAHFFRLSQQEGAQILFG